MNALIEVQHVFKYYEELCVNHDINLSIPKGSIYGLLGQNGAGKTTLLRMLSTVTTPDKGSILFNGIPLNSSQISQIGYMPEERGLYKKMSVVDQLLFFAEIKGFSKKQARESVKYWLNKLEIIDWADKKMEELSKGMAQKIQFISTILHEPQFLILDEPFSGFDPVNADIIKNLILDLKARGTTILFSTHRMDNVEELCDNMAIIHKGNKILDGQIKDIRQSYSNNQYLIQIPKDEEFRLSEYQILKNTLNPLDRREILIQLQENQTSKILLSELIQNHTVIGFEEFIPSIHQIFVDIITNSHE